MEKITVSLIKADEIHGLAWATFEVAMDMAKELKLHGAGQDLLEIKTPNLFNINVLLFYCKGMIKDDPNRS